MQAGQDTARDSARDIQRVAIVGARGQMGALFVRALHKAGLSVASLDRPYDPDGTGAAIKAALAGAGLVVLSVPVTAMRAVAGAVAPFMDAGAILCDVCSVKVNPRVRNAGGLPWAGGGHASPVRAGDSRGL